MPREADLTWHLVVVWCRHEPERVGEVCSVARGALLGRGADSEPGDPPKLELARQRPGGNVPTGFLTSLKLSRRQWLLAPKGERGLHVQSVGRRQLLHNGTPCNECLAADGDTLSVEGVLVCLVERRPRLMPGVGAPTFPFGAADADGIVGESPAAWQLRGALELAGKSAGHVLILGESGAGKERCAQAVHRHATGGVAPYVTRNAATIPAGLVEAELFGNVGGYPNAGMPARRGLVGAAHGGHLFLDEVAELNDAQQASLLRVLDAGEYQRLGDDGVRRSQFRLLAATNRDPAKLKHDFLARFLERIRVPGLEERRSDIPLLARHLLSVEEASALRPELIESLVRHRYTHHVRELERLLRLAKRGSSATEVELTDAVAAELELPVAGTPPNPEQIQSALRQSTSIVEAAAKLGLPSRFALYRLMKRHGITHPNEG